MQRTSLLLLACLAIGAAASLALGQDANWDLRNYHLINPYAALHGRLDVDLAPAGLQSYFNPTLDLVYETLATGPLATHPRWLAALAGLPYGALIFATLALARTLLARTLLGGTGPARAIAILAATAAGVTSAATLTQVGTTFNEVSIAALVLAGLALAIHRRAIGAGLLLGAAAGLKLTALIFAPGIALALLVGSQFVGLRRFRAAILFCTAWVAAFAAFAAWWSWLVFERFGSPFFPLFNAVFRSPWFPPISFFDTRFLPHSALQWLFYPFYFLTDHNPALNSELAYRDPRLALGWLAAFAGAVALMAWLARRRPVLPQPVAFALLFWAVSYLLWLRGSSIMRYGVVLDALGVLLFIALLVRALRSPWLGALAAAAVAAGSIAWTITPDYGRLAYGPRVFDVDMGWTRPQTLFVAITGPTAYLGVFVPPEAKSRMVGFSFINRMAETWPLTTRTAAMVRDNPGPIVVLIPPGDRSMVEFLPLIGLSPDLGPCRAVHSNLDADGIQACEARKLDQ